MLLVCLHTPKLPHVSVEDIIFYLLLKLGRNKEQPQHLTKKKTCKLSLGSSTRPFFFVKGWTQTQGRLASTPGPIWLPSFISDISGDWVSSHWWEGSPFPLVEGNSHPIGGRKVSSHWWKGSPFPLVEGKSHSDMTNLLEGKGSETPSSQNELHLTGKMVLTALTERWWNFLLHYLYRAAIPGLPQMGWKCKPLKLKVTSWR